MGFVFDKRETFMENKTKTVFENDCESGPPEYNSMGESNTLVSAYTLYRHLQQYCSHPSIYHCLKDCNVSGTHLQMKFNLINGTRTVFIGMHFSFIQNFTMPISGFKFAKSLSLSIYMYQIYTKLYNQSTFLSYEHASIFFLIYL